MRFRDIEKRLDEIDSEMISIRDRLHPRAIGKGLRVVISVYGCSAMIVLAVGELWYRRWDAVVMAAAISYLLMDREVS